MNKGVATLVFFAAYILAGSVLVSAQAADGGPLIPKATQDRDDHPKSFKEILTKLRIEKEKKEFDEMLDRGEEALKISEELEKAFEQNGRLNTQEINKLVAVEKLVKKIRKDLGGDDDEEGDSKGVAATTPIAQGDAVKTFRSTTVKLFEELKKTTRFTVSAAAIQASNAVLKLARILRIAR